MPIRRIFRKRVYEINNPRIITQKNGVTKGFIIVFIEFSYYEFSHPIGQMSLKTTDISPHSLDFASTATKPLSPR